MRRRAAIARVLPPNQLRAVARISILQADGQTVDVELDAVAAATMLRDLGALWLDAVVIANRREGLKQPGACGR